MLCLFYVLMLFFFFTPPPTTAIYTLSLHDALPISSPASPARPNTVTSTASSSSPRPPCSAAQAKQATAPSGEDRKSTRLNSSHLGISYAVFCLKKKKQ